MQECVSMAAAVLKEGKVIALPTDTVYGIAALAQSTDAVQKLYEIKGRHFEKPVAISVGNIQDVHKQVHFIYYIFFTEEKKKILLTPIVQGGLVSTICLQATVPGPHKREGTNRYRYKSFVKVPGGGVSLVPQNTATYSSLS